MSYTVPHFSIKGSTKAVEKQPKGRTTPLRDAVHGTPPQAMVNLVSSPTKA